MPFMPTAALLSGNQAELASIEALATFARSLALGTSEIPGFDSAGNVALRETYRWVAMRIVARHTGILTSLHLKLRTTGGSSYAGGTGGIGRFELRWADDGGYPDLTTEGLMATQDIVISAPVAGEYLETTWTQNMRAGQEYFLVVHNVDGAPDTNYFSLNFGAATATIAPLGATGRNERNPGALDSYYSLDPREAVFKSLDSGITWWINYMVPTYFEEYSGDSFKSGQPFYTCYPCTGQVTQTFKSFVGSRMIEAVGCYFCSGGGSTLIDVITNDGGGDTIVQTASLMSSGAGHVRTMLSSPVYLSSGWTLKLRARSIGTGGADIRAVSADDAMATAAGLGTGYDFWLEDNAINPANTGFTSLAAYLGSDAAAVKCALPLYPLQSVYPLQTYAIPSPGKAMLEEVAEVSGLYVPNEYDEIIICDATGSSFSVNMPIPKRGKRYTVKKIDSSIHTVTLTPSGSMTFDGNTTWPLLVQYQWVTIVAGAYPNWHVIGAT